LVGRTALGTLVLSAHGHQGGDPLEELGLGVRRYEVRPAAL
jgi:hypothetical protein